MNAIKIEITGGLKWHLIFYGDNTGYSVLGDNWIVPNCAE